MTKPKAKGTTAKKTAIKKKPAEKRKTTTKAAPKAEPIRQKSLAEQICENVHGDIKAQAVTLTNAVLAIQEKIEQQIPIYKQMPLAQTVKVGTGEKMLRANPATQEFRATVRDYAAALNCLKEILNAEQAAPSSSPIDDLRSKFRVG